LTAKTTGPADTTLDHIRLVAGTCDRLAQFVAQLIEIGTTEIAEFDALEIVSNTFEYGALTWVRA
jgi:hypothetical protein